MIPILVSPDSFRNLSPWGFVSAIVAAIAFITAAWWVMDQIDLHSNLRKYEMARNAGDHWEAHCLASRIADHYLGKNAEQYAKWLRLSKTESGEWRKSP